MQISNLPVKYSLTFGSSAGAGYIRTIPSTPTGTPGQASFQQGFPPENFQPVAAGGVPPFGQDFNGLCNSMTSWLQWLQAGLGVPYFDGTFSAAVNGYPKGAFLQSSTTPGQFWISLADNNLVNPDSGFSVAWQAFPAVIRASTTFYVNPATGSDSYNGTSATVSGTTGPWATLQHAADVIGKFNLNGYTITVQCADSASYANVVWPAITGAGLIKLLGNQTTPANCVVTPPGGTGVCAMVFSTGSFYVAGFKLSANNANNFDCVNMTGGGCSVQFGSMRFGAANRAHFFAQGGASISYETTIGSLITLEAGANATSHIIIVSGATISVANPPGAGGFPDLTILGACSFSGGWLQCYASAYSNFVYDVITGAVNATGPHFNVFANGVINANGLGANYYPGSVAGIQATGGQYF